MSVANRVKTSPRPSAVAWPASWRTAPLWSLFERIKDVGHPDEDMLSVYRNFGVVKKDSRDDNFNKTAENRDIYQLVDDGWLIVNRMKAWQGSVGISPYRGIVSGHYICFRPTHRENSRFLNWLLRSEVYAHEYARLSRGVRPNQIEIDNDELRTLPVRLPPLEEQRRIADFLDAETARVDRLIGARTEQGRRLDVRRLAAISETFEQLVATHGAVRLRYVIQGIEQGWSPQCEERLAEAEEWGVIKAGCVNGGHFNQEQHKALPTDVKPRTDYRLAPGDLLMSRASGSPDLIGSVAVVPPGIRKLLLCDKVYRIHVDSRRARPEFLAIMLRSHANREHIKLGISGAEGMANNLPTAVVKNCLVPAAPVSVQDLAVAVMDDQLNWIDQVQRLALQQLSALAERRQALITAAVTGQFDVTTARGADLS